MEAGRRVQNLIIGFCSNAETTSGAESTTKANLQAYSTLNCVSTYIFNFLSAKNFNITFCMNSQQAGNARYNPLTNSLTFTTLFTAGDSRVMEHEMFHAFQDDFYGNMELYGSQQPGYVNIEFEQALMADIAKDYSSAFDIPNATQTQKTNYNLWRASIVNDFSRHGVPVPGSARYNTFMTNYFNQLNQFNSIPGNKYSSQIISELKPDALYSILQNSNPTCI